MISQSPRPQLKFTCLGVRQRDTKFYITSVAAATLVNICAGLDKQDASNPDSTLRKDMDAEDAGKIVNALNSSAFSQEVSRLQAETYDEDLPYQRIFELARAKEIASYLREEDAILPNGIILALRDGVDFELTEAAGIYNLDVTTETNELPFNIIDGQHRVEGLRLLVNEDDCGDFSIPVTILLDFPFWAQAQLFAVVNGRQKQVPRSRIYDLLGYLPMSDSKTRHRAYQGEMALQRFCHHVAKVINQSAKSPWHDKIKMRGSGRGVISQAAFVDHLSIYMSPRKERASMKVWPVLYPYYHNSDLVGVAKVVIRYFLGIKIAHPSFWDSDTALKSSLFGKTNGIAVCMQLMHDMIVEAGGPDNLTTAIVADKWKSIKSEAISSPPKGGSKGYQAELITEFRARMFTKDFAIKPTKNHIETLRGCEGLT